MVMTTLSRPTNERTNRLGFAAPWVVPTANYLQQQLYTALFKVYMSSYLKVLWKSGMIHSNHLFFNSFYGTLKFLTLPIFVDSSQIKKYYRLVRLKYSTRFRNRRNYYMRKFLIFLHMSEFFFYKINTSILVVLYFHLPEPLKRLSFLQFFRNKDWSFGGKDTLRYSTVVNKQALMPFFERHEYFL